MRQMTMTLDVSAKPIELIPVREAVAQVAADMISGEAPKIQVLKSDESVRFRSKSLDIPAPIIVLFPRYVELSNLEGRYVTSRVLFARDNYTCQYCGLVAEPGKASKTLTIDHVKPIHLHKNRGEATTWENCVAACAECNTRKGGHLPRECGMMPMKTPVTPHYVQLRFAGRVNDVQRDYIEEYYSGEGSQIEL